MRQSNALPPKRSSRRRMDTSLLADKILGLSTCACILLKCGEHDGEPVVRPYTPFSANPAGKFELLVK
eukprot:565271-Prorocentrum_lima.AAC.1